MRKILFSIAVLLMVNGVANAQSSSSASVPAPPSMIDSPVPRYTGTNAGQAERQMMNACLTGDSHCPQITPNLGNGTKASSIGPANPGSGNDSLLGMNGARTNEKNILDFGAIASTTRINCSTTAAQTTMTCTGIGSTDFVNASGAMPSTNENVVIYGAGATPSVATPTAVATPVTTTNTISGTHGTRFAQGCTVQNGLAWCTSGNPICNVTNVGFYEAGNSVTIAGAGVAGALTATIVAEDDIANTITLGTNPSTTVNGAAITGANCTATRHHEVCAIDLLGGWRCGASIPVTNAASALNWGDWDDVQVTVPSPAGAPTPTYPLASNIPIAWVMYCSEGAGALQLCGVEVPTYSGVYTGSTMAGWALPWNDLIIGSTAKGFPSAVTFHDVGRWYGHDLIQGTTPPGGSIVNQNVYGKVTSIVGNTVVISLTLGSTMGQTGTFPMGHDNGPNVIAAEQATCDPSTFQCGTAYVPKNSKPYPVASTIVDPRGIGLKLLGAGGTMQVENDQGPGSTLSPSAFLWTGPIGGTLRLSNQQTKPIIEGVGLHASGGTTMGVAWDVDGFDPGDGGGQPVTTTRPTCRDSYIGQASVGIRLANINPSNAEFGIIDGCAVNEVYSSASGGIWGTGSGGMFSGASGIGLLIDASNSLGTRVSSSQLGGEIGVWSNQAGFSVLQSQTGEPDGIGVVLAGGFGHPVTLDTSRNEHLARLAYSAAIGNNGAGVQLSLRQMTYTDVRIPSDGCMIALTGAQATKFDTNEFQIPPIGFGYNDTTTVPFPNGVICPGQNTPIVSEGNFWSTICYDPFALTSGNGSILADNCVNAAGNIVPLGQSDRLGGLAGSGMKVGYPGNGSMGVGTLNVQGLTYLNGTAIGGTNWTGSANAVVSNSAANVWPAQGNGTAVATTSEGTVSQPVPTAGKACQLYCFTTNAAGTKTVAGGTNYVFALRQNLASSTLTCTEAAGANFCQDTAAGHCVTLAAGDQLDFIDTPSGTPTALIPHCSVVVDQGGV